MATNNMHSLTTLIKRLEAATTRLEDIASSSIELPQAVPGLQESISSPAAAVASKSIAAPAEELPESIEEFDSFLHSTVANFVSLSDKHGGVLAEQAHKVKEGFEAQRKFLLITTKAKKPDMTGSEMAVYQDLLKPINEALMDVTSIKDANRGSPDFNHLSTVSEGIMVLAWVTVDNKPYKHVEDSLGSAQFFGNRVLKEFKEKDPKQVEWVQAFYKIFHDLADYVKQYFSGGIIWKVDGSPAQEVAKSLKSGSAPAAAAAAAPPPPGPPPPPGGAGGPPPPPPPGPPPKLDIKNNAAAAKPSGDTGAEARGAMFAEINRGSDVTKGLRKVDKSQMTHKNPALRAAAGGPSGSARGKSPPVPSKKPKPESMRMKKPPRKELEDKKWVIENFDKTNGGGPDHPIEIDLELSHSVLISKCSNTTILLRGKGNAVTVENTTRLSLVVETLVSTVDVVKSANFALQVMGTIPTVMLDQVDGAQVYLSKESTGTQLFISKTDGVNLNVLVPSKDEEGEEDYKEVPLPSQICSYYDTDKGELVSEIVAHAG